MTVVFVPNSLEGQNLAVTVLFVPNSLKGQNLALTVLCVPNSLDSSGLDYVPHFRFPVRVDRTGCMTCSSFLLLSSLELSDTQSL